MKTYKFDRGFLINGDCLKVLPRVRPSSVDLVFADPPFNIGYEYDQYKDKRPKEDYLKWTKTWVSLCNLAMKPTASIFVAIGDEYVADVKLILDKFFHMRNWIIWHYTFGVYCQTKFGRDHAHILYYCKDPKRRAFNAGEIRVPSSRQLLYRDKRANVEGRVPGDVWTYPRVCGTFKERNDSGHKCQMPEGILDRIVRATTQVGDCVLDPFAGTGTTAAVAASLKRKFITVELSRDYSVAAARRIAKRARLL